MSENSDSQYVGSPNVYTLQPAPELHLARLREVLQSFVLGPGQIYYWHLDNEVSTELPYYWPQGMLECKDFELEESIAVSLRALPKRLRKNRGWLKYRQVGNRAYLVTWDAVRRIK